MFDVTSCCVPGWGSLAYSLPDSILTHPAHGPLSPSFRASLARLVRRGWLVLLV